MSNYTLTLFSINILYLRNNNLSYKLTFLIKSKIFWMGE